MENDENERAQIVTCMQLLISRSLTSGTSGNASVRHAEGMLITPTGVAPDHLSADQIVHMQLGGDICSGRYRPSSEWMMHAGIYQARPDINAIVHCHSRQATALSCLRIDIPSFHYMVAVAGGDSIRCAPYATFGTRELAEYAVTALQARRACLLANHGQIACGATLESALGLATDVEELAAQYHSALLIGTPALLDTDEMNRVIQRFAGYGQPERLVGQAD